MQSPPIETNHVFFKLELSLSQHQKFSCAPRPGFIVSGAIAEIDPAVGQLTISHAHVLRGH